MCYPCLSGAREIQTLKPTYREHVLEGTFAYDFRDQHIRIDKSDQIRLKSWKTSWIGLLVRTKKSTVNDNFAVFCRICCQFAFMSILYHFTQIRHLAQWSPRTYLFPLSTNPNIQSWLLRFCYLRRIPSLLLTCKKQEKI